MMGMHLPLSMRRTAGEQQQQGKGREEGGGRKGEGQVSVGVRYLSWLRQDLQDKRLEAAVSHGLGETRIQKGRDLRGSRLEEG